MSHGPLTVLLFWTALAAAAVPAQAPAEHVRAALLSERTALAGGQTALLGVRFDIDPGWHVYAAARNDTGFPIRVEPRFPPGYVAGPLQWPAPRRHISAGELLDHVYQEQVLLLLPVSVPADAVPGSEVTFGAHLEWLVCQDVCLAGAADVTLTLPVVALPGGGSEAGGPGPNSALFEATRARLPGPPTLPLTATVLRDALKLHAPGASGMAFVPAEDCVDVPRLLAEGATDSDTLTLSLSPDRDANAQLIGSVELRFEIAGSGKDNRSRIFRLEIPTPPAAAASTMPAAPILVSFPVSPGENP